MLKREGRPKTSKNRGQAHTVSKNRIKRNVEKGRYNVILFT